MKANTRASLIDRIVKLDNGCWIIDGIKPRPDGYVRADLRGKVIYAHRLVYEALVGKIPRGMELDHRCRARHCVNPSHLEPVTHKENTLRGFSFVTVNKSKTHCPAGHRYTKSNTILEHGGSRRRCRKCHNEQVKRYEARKKAGLV